MPESTLLEHERSQTAPSVQTKTSSLPSWVVTLCILFLALGLFFLVYGNWNELESGRSVQSTDDANVRADITAVSTKASGLLAHLEVAEYQHVNSGQLIASIRDEDYKAERNAAQAGLEAAEAATTELLRQEEAADSKVQQAKAGIQAAEGQVAAAQAGIVAAKSTIRSAEAGLKGADAQSKNATEENERQSGLYSSKATTLQKLQTQEALTAAANAALEGRETDVRSAEALLEARLADVKRAEAGLESSKADLAGAISARRLLTAKENEVRAGIDARRSALESAKIALGYTVILAPVAGYIASRNVLPGQIVSPGTTVVSLVEEAPWVQANFKETQLTHMRSGDVAEIQLDTYPARIWKGHVLMIAPATGAQTALLPADNATGNFTKIVQRIPVKISIDSNQDFGALRPGMSATVRVRVERRG